MILKKACFDNLASLPFEGVIKIEEESKNIYNFGGRLMENKELYKMISEIGQRTARTEEKVDILMNQTSKLEKAENQTIKNQAEIDRAHKRLDAADKWIFGLGSATAVALLSSVLKLLGIG